MNTEFLNTYGATHIYEFASQPERCLLGAAPTIRQATINYGFDTLVHLLCDIFKVIETCSSARRPLSEHTRRNICSSIIIRHPHMKVPALHMFAVRVMAGEFGKFYDRLDGIEIATMFNEFAQVVHEEANEYRLRARDRELDQQRAEQDAAWRRAWLEAHPEFGRIRKTKDHEEATSTHII